MTLNYGVQVKNVQRVVFSVARRSIIAAFEMQLVSLETRKREQP